MGRLLLEICASVAGIAVTLLLIWWLEDDFAEDLGHVSKGWRRTYWRRKSTDEDQ